MRSDGSCKPVADMSQSESDNPASVPPSPVAMGFMTPALMPQTLNAVAMAAVTIVLPTPVSVPVTKRPGGFRSVEVKRE